MLTLFCLFLFFVLFVPNVKSKMYNWDLQTARQLLDCDVKHAMIGESISYFYLKNIMYTKSNVSVCNMCST